MASMWRRAMHYLGLGPDDEYDDYDEYDVTGEHPLPARPQPTRYASTPGVPRPSAEPRSSVRTLAPSLDDDLRSNGANGNGNGAAAHDGDRPYSSPRSAARAERSDRAERLERLDRLGADRDRSDRSDRSDRDRSDRMGSVDRIGDRDRPSDRDRDHPRDDRPSDRAADRDRSGADRADRDRSGGDRSDRADRDRGDRSDRADRSDRDGEDDGGGRPRPAVVRPLVTAPPKPHVVGPASFDDAQEIADKFKATVPVILNLQGVQRDLSRRIIDFSSGLCYALDGHMERVANQVYLLTPTDVEVSADERRRLQERGYEA
jgi:cell division inhibitor SepF